MDNLEQHIKKNREALDYIEQPEIDVIWSGIESRIETPQNGWNITIGRNWRWSIAASIALLIVASIVFPVFNDDSEEQIDLAATFPELVETEGRYKQLVHQKEQEINLSKIDHQEFSHLFEELALLESIYKENLQEINRNIPNDRMVNILIKYYEQKIRVLERLSNEIEKRNRHEEISKEQSI